MAACVNAVTTASTVDGTSFVTDPFTPAAGDLLVVLVVGTGTLASPTSIVSSVGGQTFALRNNNAGVLLILGEFFATAVSQTVTLNFAASQTGQVINVVRVSGMERNGIAAERQRQGNGGPLEVTPVVPFDNPCLAANPTLVVLGNLTNPAAVTVPVGWTNRANTGYDTPTTGCTYETRDSGFTGVDITWGGDSPTAWLCSGFELDASPLSTPGPPGLASDTPFRLLGRGAGW
jgi:hypothetical protein